MKGALGSIRKKRSYLNRAKDRVYAKWRKMLLEALRPAPLESFPRP